MSALTILVEQLATHPAVLEKALIGRAYEPAQNVSGGIQLGDDCAAIPDPTSGGYLLFAAEGMLSSFVEEDPWFAGYSAVMVNLSDIAAMGGRPIAVTNVLTTPDHGAAREIWSGMRSASEAYGVPIVGGHTTLTGTGPTGLSASVLGRAGDRLLTSFDARPGDALLIAIDMRGSFRNGKPFWNASTETPPGDLRRDLGLLPELAESGLCRAAKDISNGGVVGTLAMLCSCSNVGATLDLDRIPKPDGSLWRDWLTSFPSYGYLMSVPQTFTDRVAEHFAPSGITCREIGEFSSSPGVVIQGSGETVGLEI